MTVLQHLPEPALRRQATATRVCRETLEYLIVAEDHLPPILAGQLQGALGLILTLLEDDTNGCYPEVEQ